MREVSAPARTPHRDTTFVVQKDGERWSFGASRQLFVSFESRDQAVAHAEEIIRRIPDASFAVVD